MGVKADRTARDHDVRLHTTYAEAWIVFDIIKKRQIAISDIPLRRLSWNVPFDAAGWTGISHRKPAN